MATYRHGTIPTVQQTIGTRRIRPAVRQCGRWRLPAVGKSPRRSATRMGLLVRIEHRLQIRRTKLPTHHDNAMRIPRMTTRRWSLAIALQPSSWAETVWLIRNPGTPFDSVAWQAHAQVQQGVRLKMADRLVAWRTLQGKTRQQVVDLLGKPSDEGYFRNWDLVYWLGNEGGFISIDSEWLVVRLGKDDRVADCRIVKD